MGSETTRARTLRPVPGRSPNGDFLPRRALRQRSPEPRTDNRPSSSALFSYAVFTGALALVIPVVLILYPFLRGEKIDGDWVAVGLFFDLLLGGGLTVLWIVMARYARREGR